MRRKLIGVFVIMLFVGAGVLPSVSGNLVEEKMPNPIIKGTIFVIGFFNYLSSNINQYYFHAIVLFYIKHFVFSGLYINKDVILTFNKQYAIMTRYFVCGVFTGAELIKHPPIFFNFGIGFITNVTYAPGDGFYDFNCVFLLLIRNIRPFIKIYHNNEQMRLYVRGVFGEQFAVFLGISPKY